MHLSDRTRLRERLAAQGPVILALDGLQPDVGHEVLWVLRDCVSGEVLVARSLLGATENDLTPLLEEVAGICQKLTISIAGVISDGQHSIRNAVAHSFPGVPHQLCHFHYLREAAKPVYEADRHAKKELKKHLRGVRPIERAVEHRTDPEADAVRGYCLAVRSALTDDEKPPCFCGVDLQPGDIERWYVLRDELDLRQHIRRVQTRFRRDPGAYLADLENKLLLLRLPP